MFATGHPGPSGGSRPPAPGPVLRAGGLLLAGVAFLAGCGVPTGTPEGVASATPSGRAPAASASAPPTSWPTAGTPAPTTRPTPPPGPAASPSGGAGSPDDGAPPASFPGAALIADETRPGETLVVIELLYDVPAPIGDVRAHYRRVLREEGWRIGEVELDGVEWEIEATKGEKEIEIEIEPAGARSLVEVVISVPARP